MTADAPDADELRARNRRLGLKLMWTAIGLVVFSVDYIILFATYLKDGA